MIIFHRNYVFQDQDTGRLMAKLAQAHPRAQLSYHPHWEEIGYKWTFETCFRAGEQASIMCHDRQPT